MRALRLLPLLLPGLLAAAAPSAGGPATGGPATARAELDTERGPIVVEVDLRHAPITARNFMAYVDEHRFDGATFYRVAPGKRDPRTGFVEGGIGEDATRAKFAIDHEPTTLTGLHHTDGALSMARNAPGTAAGNFSIMVGDQRYLDARPGFPGYAVFGHVVRGMDVVRGMLPLPTYPGGYTRTTMHQTLIHPVRILRARRLP